MADAVPCPLCRTPARVLIAHGQGTVVPTGKALYQCTNQACQVANFHDTYHYNVPGGKKT